MERCSGGVAQWLEHGENEAIHDPVDGRDSSLGACPARRIAQTPAPAQKAKFVPPVKGTATIEVMQTPSKRVGKDMVTVYKVRNTSKGSINLLKIDEYWYDRKQKIVSGAPTRTRRRRSSRARSSRSSCDRRTTRR